MNKQIVDSEQGITPSVKASKSIKKEKDEIVLDPKAGMSRKRKAEKDEIVLDRNGPEESKRFKTEQNAIFLDAIKEAVNKKKVAEECTREPFIILHVNQYPLATTQQITEAEDKKIPLKKYKNLDNLYYLPPYKTKHVLFNPAKAQELRSKYGSCSSVNVKLNSKFNDPRKDIASSKILELLLLKKISGYNDDECMYTIDSSELANNNLICYCKESLNKNYNCVHLLRVHIFVGYKIYGLKPKNYSCFNSVPLQQIMPVNQIK